MDWLLEHQKAIEINFGRRVSAVSTQSLAMAMTATVSCIDDAAWQIDLIRLLHCCRGSSSRKIWRKTRLVGGEILPIRQAVFT